MSARKEDKFTAVVVFPQPPFWLTMAMERIEPPRIDAPVRLHACIACGATVP
jgi:hypothetical protein